LRLVRKKELQRKLEKLRPHPNPNLNLEQYTIPADIAADILYMASYIYDDIQGRDVLDLGCGTGRITIGALLMKADKAIGIDIDVEAITAAEINAKTLGIKQIDFIISDIETLKGRFHATIMNPPFGTRIKHKDRQFLQKAIELSEVVYSIHKRSSRKYLLRFVESKGAYVDALFPRRLMIPWMFHFHSKERRWIEVDILRILT
jgi:putative methylase